MNFAFLPDFARYILANHLDEYIEESLRVSREIKLPLLKIIEALPPEVLGPLMRKSTEELLGYISRNEADEQLAVSTKRWIDDQLGVMGQRQIVAEDITGTLYVRKRALVYFLPRYTADPALFFDVIREIDEYNLAAQTRSTQTYIELLQARIEEQLHFNEKITQTLPGVVYIFDLQAQQEVYSNQKVEALLGYTHDELTAMGSTMLPQLQHPDDLPRVAAHFQTFDCAKDGEVRTFEHRLKNKQGEYLWIRNYESVFKRTPEGKPWQLIGVGFDISQEKENAQELINREAQLLEAQEIAELGSFEWDLTTLQSRSTPEVLKIFELDSTVGLEGFLTKVHPADQAKVRTATETSIRTGELYECQYRYLGRTHEKVIWSRGTMAHRPDGRLIMKGTVMDVTQRHHLLQRLQQSEELQKQTQALTHIGNWAWDIAKNQVTWSDEMYRIYGLEPQSEEITFERYLSLTHPDDRQRVSAIVGQSLELLQPNEFYHRIVLPNGTIRTLQAKGDVLTDLNGQPYQMIGTGQDVTERVLAEQQLLEKQALIEKITNAAPSVIASYNVNTGKYVFVNQGLKKLLGYDPEQALAEGVAFFVNLIHPDDLGPLLDANTQALAAQNSPGQGDDEAIAEFTYRLRHQNGQYRWFHTYGTIFDRNRDGQVGHVLNISMDITERVEAEQKIKEQELFIEHIADASPAMLYLYDLGENQVRYVNREITLLLGYTPEEIMTMGAAFGDTMYYAEDRLALHQQQQAFYEANETGSLLQYEVRMNHKQQGWRWMLVREVIFSRGTDGQVAQILGAALDISGRKEMENDLMHKTQQLQQSNANLQEFAYVASHDLKEPIRKISTFGDRLLSSQHDRLSPDGQLYLEKIIKSSNQMQTIINDVLSISTVAGDRSYQPYNLRLLLGEVVLALEHKIEHQKATVVVDSLPDSSVVPLQLRQLFVNLLSNSLKFARPDVPPRIEITHRFLKPSEVTGQPVGRARRYLELQFTDNGIGFDNKFAGKIFAIFQRLHGKSDYEGNGIGLAICKKVVENHGGTIWATGTPNKGATFTVLIPE